MLDTFETLLSQFFWPLGTGQRVLIALLLTMSVVTGIRQGFVIRRALRDAGPMRRLAGWGWDIRMLRQSYYPPSGRHLHPTIVRLYAISIGSATIMFLLLVWWLIL